MNPVGAERGTWSAKIVELNERLMGAQKLLDPYSRMREGVFPSQSVQDLTRSDYPPSSQFKSRHLLVMDITSKEMLAAPKAILMVFSDLGLTENDKVEASVVFKNMDVQYSPRHFWLILRPAEVTEDQVGVILSSYNSNGIENKVIVPRSPLNPLGNPQTERAQLVNRTYASYMGSRYTLHPYLVEILCAGAEWMSYLLNSRLSSRSAD